MYQQALITSKYLGRNDHLKLVDNFGSQYQIELYGTTTHVLRACFLPLGHYWIHFERQLRSSGWWHDGCYECWWKNTSGALKRINWILIGVILCVCVSFRYFQLYCFQAAKVRGRIALTLYQYFLFLSWLNHLKTPRDYLVIAFIGISRVRIYLILCTLCSVGMNGGSSFIYYLLRSAVLFLSFHVTGCVTRCKLNDTTSPVE